MYIYIYEINANNHLHHCSYYLCEALYVGIEIVNILTKSL